MALWLEPADAQRLRAKELNLAILFRMRVGEQTPRLWFGHGDFEAPADPLEPSPHPIYRGVGDLNDLPELSELVNGETDRVEFTLSGVGETAAGLADQSADDIEGAEVRIGLVVLGQDLQAATKTLWLWFGQADMLKPDWNGLANPPTYSLTLSAATQTASRRRNAIIYYSATQQRARSPGDKSCDRVSLFNPGYRFNWPVY